MNKMWFQLLLLIGLGCSVLHAAEETEKREKKHLALAIEQDDRNDSVFDLSKLCSNPRFKQALAITTLTVLYQAYNWIWNPYNTLSDIVPATTTPIVQSCQDIIKDHTWSFWNAFVSLVTWGWFGGNLDPLSCTLPIGSTFQGSCTIETFKHDCRDNQWCAIFWQTAAHPFHGGRLTTFFGCIQMIPTR